MKRIQRMKIKHGVTLVEVLFSIGIITVGLAFIASIIPVASRQAYDSYQLTQSAMLGQNAFREVMVRKLHYPSASHPWLGMQEAAKEFLPITDMGVVSGVSTVIEPLDASVGICIDPLFWATQPGVRTGDPSLLPDVGPAFSIQRSCFPYYHPNQSPLANHHDVAPSALTWGGATAAPRMIRVTLPLAPELVVPAVVGVTPPMRSKQAQALFGFRDGLVTFTDPDDRSQKGVRGFDGLVPPSPAIPSPGNMDLMKGTMGGEMSWFMTLAPHEQFITPTPPLATSPVSLQDFYTLSIVVLAKRDRSFDPVPPSSTILPVDERIAWAIPPVIPPSGVMPSTNSGSGFSVKLIANVAVDPKLNSGDWIMLSRAVADPATTAYVKHIHRWYRIAGLDKEARPASTAQDPTVDPYGNPIGTVWVRSVHLVGPAWSFSAGAPTVATLVKGVTSVYERVVTLPK